LKIAGKPGTLPEPTILAPGRSFVRRAAGLVRRIHPFDNSFFTKGEGPISYPQPKLSTPVILSKRAGAAATEGASKDLGNVSFSMPLRGVLTKMPVPAFRCATDPNYKFRTLVPSGELQTRDEFDRSPWVELPESASWRRHLRDLSTRPKSLRSCDLAQDDRRKGHFPRLVVLARFGAQRPK